MSGKLLSEYILEQPKVLEDVFGFINSTEVPALQDLLVNGKKLPSTYMIGSGSSLNAVHASKSFWKQVTTSLEILDPLNFTLYLEKELFEPNSIVIGVSQSGQSRATVEALEKAKNMGALTLAITTIGDSPISQVAQETFIVPIGEELVGPKTKGYSAIVAFLIGLSIKIQGQQFVSDSAEKVTAYLGQMDTIDSLTSKLPNTDLCFVVGSSDNLGTAKEGALKIMEIAKIPCLHFDLEDSMHGPFTTLGENSFVVVLGLEPSMKERMEGLMRILSSLNAKGIFVSNGKIYSFDDSALNLVDTETDPIADIVPIQMLAYSFALAKGKHPTELSYDRTFVRSITKLKLAKQ